MGAIAPAQLTRAGGVPCSLPSGWERPGSAGATSVALHGWLLR